MIQKAKSKHLTNQENLRNFKAKKQEGSNKIHIITREQDEVSNVINRKSNHILIGLKPWDPSNHPYSVELSKIILKDAQNYSGFIKKIQIIKDCIVDYLYLKKINNREIQVKLKKEEETKKKEELDMKKNLDDKVSLALEKANSCLDNIKNLGKKSNSYSITNNNTCKEKKIENSEKPKTEKNIDNLVKNLTEKYNKELSINQSNMDSYFLNLADNRNKIKEFREKLKRIGTKHKSMPDTFLKIYKNNKRDILLDKTESSFLFKLNKDVEFLSITQAGFFENLYMEVMFNSKLAKDYSEDDICNVFSFWYIVKHLKTSLANKNHNEIFEQAIRNILIKQKNHDKKTRNGFLLDYIFKNIETFFKSLINSKSDTLSFKEEEIFDKNFYKLYELIMKQTKSKLLKTIIPLIRQDLAEKVQTITSSNITNHEKQILLILKWINSVIVNNGNNSYHILKK
jgi:hypothetical protein